MARALELTYHRALKELWDRHLIVAYGEVDEGAFPSLAIGATRLLFEDLFLAAQAMPITEAREILKKKLSLSPNLTRYYERTEKLVLHHHSSATRGEHSNRAH